MEVAGEQWRSSIVGDVVCVSVCVCVECQPLAGLRA